MCLKNRNNSKNDFKTFFVSKDDFRNNCKHRLSKIDTCKRLYFSKKIVEKLNKIILHVKAKNILLYLPLKNEVNILPLIKQLKKNNFTVYVPFMEGASFKLVEYRLPVAKKKYNIYESPDSWRKPQKIDVAVVPVIGVDGMIKRVGFGRGMYDRFFESLLPKPLIIFVQLTKCFTSQKLCEPHDTQADIYITPTDIIKRGRYDFRSWNRSSCSCDNRSRWFFCCKKNKFSKS